MAVQIVLNSHPARPWLPSQYPHLPSIDIYSTNLILGVRSYTYLRVSPSSGQRQGKNVANKKVVNTLAEVVIGGVMTFEGYF